MAKQKCLFEKSNKYWKKLSIQTENIGHQDWMIHCGLLEQHTKPPQVCLLTNWCKLPFANRVEKKAYWAIKELNLDPKLAKKQRLFQVQELEEFRFMAYENTKLYKKRSKLRHDTRIKKMRVLTRPKGTPIQFKIEILSQETKIEMDRTIFYKSVTPHGAIGLIGNGGQNFLVNGQRVKH